MKDPVRVLLHLVILAAILAGTVVGFRFLAARAKKSAAPTAALKAIPVRVAPVSRATLKQELMLNGTIEPVLQVDLRSKISGRLERLGSEGGPAIEEGARVKKGDIVAVLEHRDLDAQVAQAAAAVATAEAGITSARTAYSETQRERKRAENLLAQGSATEQARDKAATADERAAAGVEQAQAQLAQAKAALQAAEVVRDEATIRAPFDGVIAAKNADPGSMLTPAAPLLRIVATDEVRILVTVPTVHLPALASGKALAEVSVDVRPDAAFPCAIRTIFPEVNEVTRTATLELRAKNPVAGNEDPPLRPGMYASIRIVLETRENVLAVPIDSIIRLRERQLVFLAEGGTARSREIRTGIRENALVEVLEGVNAGDPLVVGGQQRLTDGAAIEIVPEKGQPATPETRP